MQIFLDFAPNYFAYMEKCQQTKQPTLLGKIIGVYRVSFKNNTTNAALRTSVLVMENLFYNRTITDKFDLKGSVRNRLVNLDDTCHEGELVLLDENLLNSTYFPITYIYRHISISMKSIAFWTFSITYVFQCYLVGSMPQKYNLLYLVSNMLLLLYFINKSFP